jgi:hemerythrin-like domain-containing protein
MTPVIGLSRRLPEDSMERQVVALREDPMKRSEIFDQMREDHRRVLSGIAVLEKAAAANAAERTSEGWPGGEVKGMLDLLTRQFATHMAGEDQVLYPALIGTAPEMRLSLEALRADHDTLRMMLDDLEETIAEAPGMIRDEQLAIELRDFVDLLRIHIRKEEAIVINVAERVLSAEEVEALGARMGRLTDKSFQDPGTGHSKGAHS